MHLEGLKVYCDIVRCGSFSRAAVLNGITQSAASQAVAHIEQRLGVRLIDRSVRPPVVTDAGQIYYDGARKLVSAFQELESEVRGKPVDKPQPIEIAAIYSVGLRELQQYVTRFHAVDPTAQIHIECLHPDRVYERVQKGSADLGIVSFPVKSKEFVTVPWCEEEMVLTCSPENALAAHRTISPRDLQDVPYVAFDPALVIRRRVDRLLREYQSSPKVVLEFDNIENIKKAIEINTGVALLPRPTLTPELKAGTLVAVPLTGWAMARPLGIIHARHGISQPATRFLRFLCEPIPLAPPTGLNFTTAVPPHQAGTARSRTRPVPAEPLAAGII